VSVMQAAAASLLRMWVMGFPDVKKEHAESCHRPRANGKKPQTTLSQEFSVFPAFADSAAFRASMRFWRFLPRTTELVCSAGWIR
jgi:hypothetical protein